MKTKITRLLLSAVMLMCCSVASAVGTQPAGAGTKGNPYQIATKDNLLWFADYVNSGNTTACAILMADITVNTGVLDSDGNLNSGTFETWTPIGNWGDGSSGYRGYSGDFNGNGHTISGLYFNDATKAPVGLFGMANHSNACIHDVGVKDSYFKGKSHVGGICGDLANGKIENCWNGATVICNGNNSCAGGIAGSCWTSGSVSGCYNIGKISVGTGSNSQCGGICGSVAKNTSVTYSLSNCVSLEGKCSVAYNLNGDGVGINNVSIENAEAFKSGKACWILNGKQRSATWRQLLGTDNYPMVTGDYLIYYDDGEREYLNETMCDHTTDHLHTFELKTMTQGGSISQYWHCTSCEKDYQYYNRMNELPGTECTEPSAGDGSQANPYQIATLENLMWFADHVNSGNASACAILTADITMNASVLDSEGRLNSVNFVAWTPIGGQNGKDFAGEFNGNGHTISGLYFNDTNTNNVGLFGKAVNNAHIHDLGITDSYFYGKDHVGGICGDFASGKIENCWNGANIKAKNYDAGGISGSCWVKASIANCYNIGIVSLQQDKDSDYKTNFGGICGSVYSTTTATYSIDNCYTLINNEHDKDTPEESTKLPSTSCDKIYGFLAEGCPESQIHDSYVKKAAAFMSGEVCYRLNHGVTDNSQKWYQTLESDLLPVLDNQQQVVYYSKYDVAYTNSLLLHRNKRDATLDVFGYTQECWENLKLGKIYAEEACVNELNPARIITYTKLPQCPVKTNNGFEINESRNAYSCNFDWAVVTGYDRNSTDTRSVEFIVRGTDVGNARIKWYKTTRDANFGDFTINVYVNDNCVYTRSDDGTMGDDAMEIPLSGLKQNDIVKFEVQKPTIANYNGSVTIAACLEYTRKADMVFIKVDDKWKIKGNEDPAFTWDDSDVSTNLDKSCITLTREKGEEPGTYSIHASLKEGANSLYDIISENGTLTIVEGTYHEKVEPTISKRGNIAYWEVISTGKWYADPYLVTELSPASVFTYYKLPQYPVKTSTGFKINESRTYNDCQFDWAAATTYDRNSTDTRSVEFIVRGTGIDNARIKWYKNTGDINYGTFTLKVYVNNEELYTRSDDGTMGDVMEIPLSGLKKGDIVKFEVQRQTTSQNNDDIIIAACLEYTRERDGVSVRIDDKWKIKDVEDPAFTWDDSDVPTDFDKSCITLTREKGKTPGTYSIHASLIEGANSQYDIISENGTLNIVEGTYHEKAEPKNHKCGITQDCWEVTSIETEKTGKWYADPYLVTELNPVKVTTYTKLPQNPITAIKGFSQNESVSYCNSQFDWAGTLHFTYNDYYYGDNYERFIEFVVRGTEVDNARIKWCKDYIGLCRLYMVVYVNNEVVYHHYDDGAMRDVMEIPLPGLTQGDTVKFAITDIYYGGTWGYVNIAASLEYTRKDKITITADNKKKIKGVTADPELTWQVTDYPGDYQPTGITLTREEGDEEGTYAIHVSQSEGANPDPDFDITFKDGTLTIVDGTYHEKVEPTISTRGFAQECWEVTSTGKWYADPYLVTELNPVKITTYFKLSQSPVGDYNVFGINESGTYNDCQFDWAAETTYETYKTGTRSVEFIVRGADVDNARIKWYKNTGTIGYGYFTINVYVNKSKVYTRSDDGTMGDVMAIPLPGLKQDDVVRFEVNKPDKTNWEGYVTIAACIEYTRTKEGITITADDKKKIREVEDPELTWRIVDYNGDYQLTGITLTREKGEEPGTYAIHASQSEGANPELDITFVDGTLTIVDGTYHEKVEPTISTRGNPAYSIEASTGKYYEGPYLVKEINPMSIITYYKLPLNPVISTTDFTPKEAAIYYDCQFDWAAETTYGARDLGTRSVEFAVRGADVGNARIKWYKNTGNTGYGKFTINVYVNTIEVYTRDDDGTMGGVMEIPLPDLKQDDVVKFEVNKPYEADWAGYVTIAACLEYTRTADEGKRITANQDPNKKENYYATFYSSEYACQVQEGVTAYTGKVEGNVLRLRAIADGIIPAGEAVVLRLTTANTTETQMQITLTAITTTATKSETNKLEGTDEGKTLGANQYALSLGQNGVGFYLWEGKSIGANKAYLTLVADGPSQAKAFTFMFDDGTTTGITSYDNDNDNDNGNMYNLNGIRVNPSTGSGQAYKGIIIRNGKKIYQK